jgi:hypothetical protein
VVKVLRAVASTCKEIVMTEHCVSGMLADRDPGAIGTDVIDAYLDETGIHDGAPICLICGFFGGRGQWRKVEDAWCRALDRFDVPLDKFHANEAVNRRKFFVNWDEEKHARFLLELASAITAFKVYPVNFGIVVKDFESFSENQRRFFTGMELSPEGNMVGTGSPGRPYFTPFLRLINRVASYAPVGGRAHFFFGLDRPFAGYAEEMFRILKTDAVAKGNYRERLGDTSFPLAKQTPQLQAADFFAYLSYDRARECVQTGNWYIPAVPALEMLIRKARSVDDLVFYDAATLNAILMQIPVEFRKKLA